MALLALFAIALAPFAVSTRLPSLCDDATCSVPERMWFQAEEHREEIASWVAAYNGPRDLHLLDAFGASQAMAKCWIQHHFSAASYDIKINRAHDICTPAGFRCLLELGCRLVQRGLVAAGPPCSLHVAASQSVHCRSDKRLQGNCRVFKVRLSNRIWINFSEFLRAILERNIFITLEQPTSSWAFKAHMQELAVLAHLALFLTYMGFFGHDLAKPSHLYGNMRALMHITRKLSTADRIRFADRLQKRNQRRENPRHYHKKVIKSDGTQGWQGCKSLAQSAEYTPAFCQALFSCWEAEFTSPPTLG